MRPVITPEQKAEIIRRREAGERYIDIARDMNLLQQTVRNVWVRRNDDHKPVKTGPRAKPSPVAERYVDPRDLTARLMGDPLPWRSALGVLRRLEAV